jgi:hypothetical protein
MMLRRSNPKALPEAATAPKVELASTNKTPLCTYSRRSLKRRHISPPAQHRERLFTRTGSLNMTEQKAAEQRSQAKAQQLSRLGSHKGRKRVELLKSAKKTPNDLAWEALASSGPALTLEEDDSPDEARPDGANAVKCSPGEKESDHQQSAVKAALDGPATVRRGNISGRNVNSEVDSPEHLSLEEFDGFKGGERRWSWSDQELC